MSENKPTFMVPEEARDRGPILKGELKSSEVTISDIVAQFDKITATTKKSRIHFYPTAEQAKRLFKHYSPFTFEGSWHPRNNATEHWLCSEIWLQGVTSLRYKNMDCLTFCSGNPVDLLVRSSVEPNSCGISRKESPTGWFVVNSCFVFQILATPEQEFGATSHHTSPEGIYTFALSAHARAEIKHQVFSHRFGLANEVKKMGYAIVVHGVQEFEQVQKDIRVFLILASLASRERSDFWHWSIDYGDGRLDRHWHFGMRQWPKRPKGEHPLLPRDPSECSKFLTVALNSALNSSRNRFLEAAIYPLMDYDITLETKIVKLVSGIQSALLFAVPGQSSARRRVIRELYKEFSQLYSVDLSDLWPLFDQTSGPSLTDIRNFIVHGGVFSEPDYMALSYAAEHLQWTLERILLVSLEWDIGASAVSPQRLSFYTAYDWKKQQQSLSV